MKNYYYLLLFCIGAWAISCNSKDNFIENDNNIHTRGIAHRQTIEFTSGVQVINGTLHFEDGVDIYEKMLEIQRMSDTEFNELALATGFDSYRRKLNTEQAERFIKYNKWMDSMALVVGTEKIRDIEPPFEYKVIIPEIQNALYRSVINNDGVYYVGNIKNKVSPTHVTGYSQSQTKANVEKLIGTACYVDQNQMRTIKTYNEASFSCNKKKVKTIPSKHYMASFGSDGIARKYTLNINTYTEEYSWWRWRPYNTVHYISDVSIGSLSFNNVITSDVTLNSSIYYIPDWVFSNKELFYQAPFSYTFTSRGTGAHGHGVYNSENLIPNQYVNAC